MTNPSRIWLAFFGCLLVVLIPLGWISLKVLELEKAEIKAQNRAMMEENIRLALWRMESALSPLLSQENSRPYFFYSSFYLARGTYGQVVSKGNPPSIFIPSPLLKIPSTFHLLHFQIDSEGNFSSPQVPGPKGIPLLASKILSKREKKEASDRLKQIKTLVTRKDLFQLLPPPQKPLDLDLNPWNLQSSALLPEWQKKISGIKFAELFKNQREWNQRARSNINAQNFYLATTGNSVIQDYITLREGEPFQEGLMKALWIENHLILFRRVSLGKRVYIQGCWLSWPKIKKGLLKDIEDLLPQADLLPIGKSDKVKHSRQLASLPLQLIPGSLKIPPLPQKFSPLQISLFTAWGCVLVAVLAVMLLLMGVISLSERRATFVSSVTHELRTPLTTFRMYAEMLASGRVKEEKKKNYYQILQQESKRLGHLVENVLSYAQLESKKVEEHREEITLKDLLSRSRNRLEERAIQSFMHLCWEEQEGVLLNRIKTDPTAVEQILFNLVDNSCKYASHAEDRRIHLTVQKRGKKICFHVKDHGPGIPRDQIGHIFEPFTKSDKQAAGSAPGVGLGLSLCRRLAKKLGGSLFWNRDWQGGTCFTLEI